MSWGEIYEKASASFAGWVVVTIGGGVLWIVRRVMTNQKQIELLQREIEMRDEKRADDRKAMDDLRADVKELRTDVKKLFQRGD